MCFVVEFECVGGKRKNFLLSGEFVGGGRGGSYIVEYYRIYFLDLGRFRNWNLGCGCVCREFKR